MPTPLHSSETWTLREHDRYRITAAKRLTAIYQLLNHKRKHDILKEIKRQPVLKKKLQK
jgi:hypothetical protein